MSNHSPDYDEQMRHSFLTDELRKAQQRVTERFPEGKLTVLVGPFNAHLMTPTSRQEWSLLRAQVVKTLGEKNVPHLVPDVLPSDQFADASHPLAIGYQSLAEWIHNQ